jgi:hypothetical protein
LQAGDRSLITDRDEVRAALSKEPNLLQVTVTPDAATGALWIAFFAGSDGDTTGARIGQRAMITLTTSPQFAGAEAKPEWGGVVYPDPDPSRPETFPPLPTIESITAMRRKRVGLRSDPGARWYHVGAQVRGLDRSSVAKTAAAMEDRIKQMRRVDQAQVTVSKDGSAVDLSFLIAGVGPDGGAREGFHLVDALVSMTVEDNRYQIEVREVTEAARQETRNL